MKNTIGNNITVTLFGESHGPAVGCIIDGMPAGIRIDADLIDRMMNARRASTSLSTSRHEDDRYEFLSGVMNGYTQGTPVAIVIRNNDIIRRDYRPYASAPRPSHADYAAMVKYNGFSDLSGGGHFSGRLTAPLTAAGALCLCALEGKGIQIATHISRIMDVCDRPFAQDDPAGDIALLRDKSFPVFEEEKAAQMQQIILQARENSDSVGGILETAVYGLEAGIGEPVFDSLESVISHAVFSVGGVKGIEFGAGFHFADMYGSQANDPFEVKDGKIATLTNNSGGINGGISNGMPVIFRTAIRPTPSIGIRQKSVNVSAMENTEIEIRGRHDPAIIHRAAPVITAVTAIAVLDLLVTAYGSLHFAGDAK